MGQLAQWDRDLFVFLNNLGSESTDKFWFFVTQIENWFPLYILFFLLFWKMLERKQFIIATIVTLVSLFTTILITTLAKNLFERLRPNNFDDLNGFIRVLDSPTDFSFWSGHAATSFAVTFIVVNILRKKNTWIYLICIWPILFSISRIFVGVHYPVDIFVGGLVGLIVGYIFYLLYKACAPLNNSNNH